MSIKNGERKCQLLFHSTLSYFELPYSVCFLCLKLDFFTFFSTFSFMMPQLDLGEKRSIIELRKVGRTNRQIATSKEGIKKVARKVWKAITPEYLNSLYESMPRRMAAVIAAGGGHTMY